MIRYKLFKDLEGINDAGVIKNNTVAIPFDAGNRAYQEYLEWLAEGNEPEPADE